MHARGGTALSDLPFHCSMYTVACSSREAFRLLGCTHDAARTACHCLLQPCRPPEATTTAMLMGEGLLIFRPPRPGAAGLSLRRPHASADEPRDKSSYLARLLHVGIYTELAASISMAHMNKRICSQHDGRTTSWPPQSNHVSDQAPAIDKMREQTAARDGPKK